MNIDVRHIKPLEVDFEFTVYTAFIDATFIGGATGLWDFDFNFTAGAGGSLPGKTVRFKVYDNDTNMLLADVEYLYAEFPQVDPPQVDHLGNWAADVQPFIQAGTQFIDGGGGGFTKQDWAYDSDNINDSYFQTAKNLRLELTIFTSGISNDLMDIQAQPIGITFRQFLLRYSPTSDRYVCGYSQTTATADAVVELRDGGTKVYSSKILDYSTLSGAAGTRFPASGFDEQSIVNGRPTIYSVIEHNTAGTNYQNQLVESTWNGVDGYNNTVVFSGNAWGATLVEVLKGVSLNGKSVMIASSIVYAPATPVRNEFWRMYYYDGVAWTYSVFDSLMLETGGSGNPGDRTYAVVSDNTGRVFFHRRKRFGTPTSRVDMIEWDGINPIEDPTSWTRTFLAGSQTQIGFVDGIGNVARLDTPHSFTIIGYDGFGYPIIQFYDYFNNALRQMNYDDPSGQMNVTTISTLSVDVGNDYIVQQMAYNGSEYLCNNTTNGFFTMTTAGVQTLTDAGAAGKELGTEY